jgi:hypothetical protein
MYHSRHKARFEDLGYTVIVSLAPNPNIFDCKQLVIYNMAHLVYLNRLNAPYR